MTPKQVDIDDSKFVIYEVIEAKKQVKGGTACGEDENMPEVLQRINIDKIISKQAAALLEIDEKPDQFVLVIAQGEGLYGIYRPEGW